MSITIDEKIKAMEEYVRCFPEDDGVRDLLKEHIVAKALKINPSKVLLWGGEYDIFHLDDYPDLKVTKLIPEIGLLETDSYYIYATYPNKGRSLWRIKDVDIDYYYELLVAKLMEYNPIKVVVDKTMFVYEFENGKRLMRDYKDIMNDFEQIIYTSIEAEEEAKEFELYKRLKEKYEGKGNER